MDSLVEALAEWLDAKGYGSYTNDGDIRISEFPDSPKNCIVIKNTGGFPPGLDNTKDPTVQIMVRNERYLEAESLINNITNEIHDKYNYWLTDRLYILKSDCLGEPGEINTTFKGKIFSANFHFRAIFY